MLCATWLLKFPFIIFYESLEDAVANANPISGDYESSGGELYFYVLENGDCFGSGSFNLFVNPLPPVDSEEEKV